MAVQACDWPETRAPHSGCSRTRWGYVVCQESPLNSRIEDHHHRSPTNCMPHGPALSSILVPRFILNSVTGLRDMANSYCQNQQDHQNHQPTGDDVDSPRPASRYPESRPCGLQYLVSSCSTRALLAYYPWLKCCIGTSSPMVLFDTFSYDTSKSTIKMRPAQFCRP
jgi:hypothetical protein